GVVSAYEMAWYSADASVIGATTDNGAQVAGNPSSSPAHAFVILRLAGPRGLLTPRLLHPRSSL
ncbi:hypothetical protein, partial [Nocardia carnea]|uniref:hypothetical protein n=1 Tax=Nocardia carnea TaxID=37328 RepID=UPI0024571D08